MWWSQSGFMGIANHKMVLGLHCLFFSADKTCLESSFRIWYDSSTKYTSPFFLTKIWHFAYKLDKEILRQLVVVITLAKYCRIQLHTQAQIFPKIQFTHPFMCFGIFIFIGIYGKGLIIFQKYYLVTLLSGQQAH